MSSKLVKKRRAEKRMKMFGHQNVSTKMPIWFVAMQQWLRKGKRNASHRRARSFVHSIVHSRSFVRSSGINFGRILCSHWILAGCVELANNFIIYLCSFFSHISFSLRRRTTENSKTFSDSSRSDSFFSVRIFIFSSVRFLFYRIM